MERSWLAALLCAVTVAACSSHGAAPPRWSATTSPVVASSSPADGAPVALDRGSDVTIPVLEEALGRLAVAVQPGDLANTGQFTAQPSTVAPPQWASLSSTGTVRELKLTGDIVKPVTLTFTPSSLKADDVPVLLRYTKETGWYPLAVGDTGATSVAAERTHFSPITVAVASIGAAVTGLFGAAKRWFTGRTTPPRCGQAPGWADLKPAAIDILLTCIDTNRDGSTVRTELKIKNNRGLTQEIEMPAGVAYADVEEQPERVRKFVRQVAGGRDVVLLPPGKTLTIGFTHPRLAREITITPKLSNLALAIELALRLAEYTSEKPGAGIVTALVAADGCTFGDADTLHGRLATTKDAVTKFTTNLIKCFAGFISDQRKLVAIAQQIVSLETGRDLSIVESDAAFNPRVEAVVGKFKLLSKLATGLVTADLARFAVTIWEGVATELQRALSSQDPAEVYLSLTPRTIPVTFEGYDDVKIGMSVGAARKVLADWGTLTVDNGPFCTRITAPRLPFDVVADAATQKVFAIDVHETLRTDKFVGIGSTPTVLKRKYPSAEQFEPEPNAVGYTVKGPGATSIRFELNEARTRVSFFRVGLDWTAQAYEICS